MENCTFCTSLISVPCMLMSHEDNGGEDWFQVGGRFDVSSNDFQELTSNVLSKVSDLNIHQFPGSWD